MPGISGLETLLPLTLRLVEEGILTLSQAIARVTSEPAKILAIGGGNLAIGGRADICVFDPVRRWQLRTQDILSQGRNTPFVGWDFAGQVIYTLLAGRIVYPEPCPAQGLKGQASLSSA
jgi:dihydroorotase